MGQVKPATLKPTNLNREVVRIISRSPDGSRMEVIIREPNGKSVTRHLRRVANTGEYTDSDGRSCRIKY